MPELLYHLDRATFKVPYTDKERFAIEVGSVIAAIAGDDMEHGATIRFISEAGFVSAVIEIARES